MIVRKEEKVREKKREVRKVKGCKVDLDFWKIENGKMNKKSRKGFEKRWKIIELRNGRWFNGSESEDNGMVELRNSKLMINRGRRRRKGRKKRSKVIGNKKRIKKENMLWNREINRRVERMKKRKVEKMGMWKLNLGNNIIESKRRNVDKKRIIRRKGKKIIRKKRERIDEEREVLDKKKKKKSDKIGWERKGENEMKSKDFKLMKRGWWKKKNW